jgi:hypothetical protein
MATKRIKLAGMNFKFDGPVWVAIGSKDVEMDSYTTTDVDFDLTVWVQKGKRAFVYYNTMVGGMTDKVAKRLLPKKIVNIKDENLFLLKAATYLAKKVGKELKKKYPKVEVRLQ